LGHHKTYEDEDEMLDLDVDLVSNAIESNSSQLGSARSCIEYS
jgi:hypothetical protein